MVDTIEKIMPNVFWGFFEWITGVFGQIEPYSVKKIPQLFKIAYV